jgi:hypothetical protein
LGAAAVPFAASAASALAAGFRAARGLAAAFATVPAVAESASVDGAAVIALDELGAFGARVARGFGAGVSVVDRSPTSKVTRGLRVARGLAAALVVGSVASGASLVRLDGVAGRGVDGFWATCARSIASSSGGTSLQGSLELRGAGPAADPGRSTPRL